MSTAYGQLVPPGNAHHGALVAPKDPGDVAMRCPIGAMHLNPHVSELGDGVRKPHQNNSRALGGDRIDVMAADVEIDHVAPQFRGQPFQELGRLLRRTMRSGSRPLFARIAISGGGRADGGSLGRRRIPFGTAVFGHRALRGLDCRDMSLGSGPARSAEFPGGTGFLRSVRRFAGVRGGGAFGNSVGFGKGGFGGMPELGTQAGHVQEHGAARCQPHSKIEVYFQKWDIVQAK